jgi:hypothetical protein
MVSRLVRLPYPVPRYEVILGSNCPWPYDWHWQDAARIYSGADIWAELYQDQIRRSCTILGGRRTGSSF